MGPVYSQTGARTNEETQVPRRVLSGRGRLHYGIGVVLLLKGDMPAPLLPETVEYSI